jgi:hypothetical protein
MNVGIAFPWEISVIESRILAAFEDSISNMTFTSLSNV